MDKFLENLCRSWSELRPGSKLEGNLLFGRYRAESIIGIGGTSIVLAVHDLNLERVVAIKIWNPYTGVFSRIWEDDDRFDRQAEYFRQEAKKLASLRHPNLCEIYDFGVDSSGIPWLAMEFFQGTTLRERLHEWMASSNLHHIKNIFVIVKQIVSAIDCLHRNKIYQLDIKPENILVQGNEVRVIDMASSFDKSIDNIKCKDFLRCGTPGYVAPEIIDASLNDQISPASDIFSLGATFLEMCCLYNPLASEELRALAYEALEVEKQDAFMAYTSLAFFSPNFPNKVSEWVNLYKNKLSELNVYNMFNSSPLDVPHAFVDLIARMVSPCVSKRPRNASEVIREITYIESNSLRLESKIAVSPMIEQTNQTVILFLAADPTDASRLRLGTELREIQEKLQIAKMRERFQLEQRMSVRPVDISQALLDTNPKIIHFSGHGTGEDGLCFENEIGKIHFIQADALAALFDLVSDQVECVLLNACYSRVQAEAIAECIKYVIGMDKAIGDKAAIAFSVGFYQALGAGKPIEEAYKFGCVQIRLQGIPEHLTPILISK